MKRQEKKGPLALLFLLGDIARSVALAPEDAKQGQQALEYVE